MYKCIKTLLREVIFTFLTKKSHMDQKQSYNFKVQSEWNRRQGWLNIRVWGKASSALKLQKKLKKCVIIKFKKKQLKSNRNKSEKYFINHGKLNFYYIIPHSNI